MDNSNIPLLMNVYVAKDFTVKIVSYQLSTIHLKRKSHWLMAHR